MNWLLRLHHKSLNFCMRFSKCKILANHCLKPISNFRIISSFPTVYQDHNFKSDNLFQKHKKNSAERNTFFKKRLRTKEGVQATYWKENNKHVIKIKPKDEGDIFGTLSNQKPMWYPDIDEEPKEENDISDDSVIIKNLSKRYRCPRKYLGEMKKLVKEKKIKEALDLFVNMRRHFVTPQHYHYTYMIGVCGRVGYTEMAFNLLRQMTDRSYQPTPAVLTGLFNSCAESPFPEYGLKKAHHLKEKIEMKSWQLNQITYHSMIKAFGRCGDLKTAFQVVDEMAKADVKIDVVTYSFLLMSCIANKETGFTYAVEVWRKMKARKCLPNHFTCNLLLRAARDCDVGPKEISSLLLQHWSSYSKRPYGFPTDKQLNQEQSLLLKSSEDVQEGLSEDDDRDIINQPTIQDEQTLNKKESPNVSSSSDYELITRNTENAITANQPLQSSGLLAARPVNGPEILDLVNIKTAADKLSLIGGMDGFINYMTESQIKPDIKTLTLLLECLPPDANEEDKLVQYIDKLSIRPDMDFFNMLIKRRNFRRESNAARDVLLLVNKYELTPDLITFGVLSLGSRSINQAKILLGEMKNLGMCPNIEIAGALLRNATLHYNFKYMKMMLEIMDSQCIEPNEKVLSLLEKTVKNARSNIISQEQGKIENHKFITTDFKMQFQEFCVFYEKWLKKVEFESEEQHPWQQYKTSIIDKYEGENEASENVN